MNPSLEGILQSWPFDPWLLAGLALTAAIYLRGYLILSRRDLNRWHLGRPTAFLAGLTTIYIALASPIEPFAGLLLQVHMVQHLLLMMLAPPLLWLGQPFFPMLRGLPGPIRIYWAGPLLRWPPLQRFCTLLVHPVPAWILFVGMTWVWHLPPVYELALRSPSWHYLQHFCFLASALLFWYPVVRPYPARPRWNLWLLPPYLILADIQNTALSALLCFSGQPLYPYYSDMPRLGGISVLGDQAAAGVIMWVPGSLAYLLPLFVIGFQLLFDSKPIRKMHKVVPPGRIPLPLLDGPAARSRRDRFDILRVPVLGAFLKWRHARLMLQLPLLLLALVVLVDGFRGPQVAPMNLAGVLPWIHWRGLLVLGLLIAGNVFCLACPFLLPRTLARRWLPAGRTWPRWLRSKWLAVVLLLLFLWAYEAFALWDSPWLTAWIIAGYFLAAFLIDGLFKGASFCKCVCPIGQFNFLLSLASPWEVAVQDPAVCASCRTKDCIRGRDGIPGCELHLYQPRKSSNLDCTFCLDCVHACPHNNIGIVAVAPGQGLWHDRQRSGLGRLSQRPDLAALALLLTFGAFANAGGMVGPVVEWQERLSSWLGLRWPLVAVTVFYLLALILVPLLLVGTAALLSRWWGRLEEAPLRLATRFAYAFIPLGFGMWLAHYSFHFLTSWETALPVTQRFLDDSGMSAGEPIWRLACCRPVGDWVLKLEILFLDLGLLLALYSAYRIARTRTATLAQMLGVLLPWLVLLLLLFAVGTWIVFQPMQMRGTMTLLG
jgi:cytochrome c oxidase assembly factor CtaG